MSEDHARKQSADAESLDAMTLLERVRSGDQSAVNALLPIVYERLRVAADKVFRGERAEHTLQPTALVHEAYIKLINQRDQAWNDQDHFCAVAAIAMRQILTDHARAKKAAKRDSGGAQVPLSLVEAIPGGEAVDAVDLDACLTELSAIEERGARIVELRFFGGLTVEQIARLLGTSEATVKRDWRRCRAWLEVRLMEMRG